VESLKSTRCDAALRCRAAPGIIPAGNDTITIITAVKIGAVIDAAMAGLPPLPDRYNRYNQTCAA
jgi:hypothetical protein